MTYHYYYSKEHHGWYGYWMDEQDNQLGEAVFAIRKEQVIIELGAARELARKIKQNKEEQQ